jgi:tetratricopeptide (TPR) repeat protein
MTTPTENRQWLKARRYFDANQFTAAQIACESLLAREPGHVYARALLAKILLFDERLREAAAQLLAAAEIPTADERLASEIAEGLTLVGEVVAAREYCAAHTQPPAPAAGRTCAELAFTLQTIGDHAGALDLIERALAKGFDDADARFFHARQLIDHGRFDAALGELEAALRMRPGFGPAAYWRSRLPAAPPAAAQLDDIAARFDFVEPGSQDHAALEFTRYEVLDRLGDYAQAWQALERANAIMHARLPVDSAHEETLIDGLIALSTQEFLQPAAADHSGPAPIFVVGLPRSGTTLLERFLTNHSQIAFAGELNDFPHQLRWQADHFERCMLDSVLLERAGRIDYAELGARYLKQTQWRAGDKRFFVDKLPPNYLLAGFIRRALPQARIVHIFRDAMDVCFSNYKSMLADAFPYSYHLPTLAAHYRQYARVMQHWRRAMPGVVLDVAHAELARAPEATLRRILDHCGLAFEPACLDLARNRAPVHTLSATQVRGQIRPPNPVPEWRRYENHLGALLDVCSPALDSSFPRAPGGNPVPFALDRR